jgi:hypothetical protein
MERTRTETKPAIEAHTERANFGNCREVFVLAVEWKIMSNGGGGDPCIHNLWTLTEAPRRCDHFGKSLCNNAVDWERFEGFAYRRERPQAPCPDPRATRHQDA